MRILAVYPLLPRYKNLGADEQDALDTLSTLQALGHKIRLLVMNNSYTALDEAAAFYRERNVDAHLLPYQRQRFSVHRLRDIAYLDGAAWEFATPYFLSAVRQAIDHFA